MSVKSTFPFGLAVNWTYPDQSGPLDATMQSWLLDTGSLTERLQSISTHFEVKVLGQTLLALEASEQRALTARCSQKWQIREVILYGDGQPWVFARSALPDHMCRSTWANLGNQPLGQRIFNDPNFVRSDFEIGHVQRHPLTQASIDTSAILQQRWARRSVFTINEDKLLVAEAFLPDCPCYAAPA